MTDRELAELARETPWHAPDAAGRQSLRDAILVEAQDVTQVSPRIRGRVLIAASVIALAAAIALVVNLRGGGPTTKPQAAVPAPVVPTVVATTQRATVQASSAADFVHSSRRVEGINDEVVRLRGGRVSVSVEKLRKDERFRVVTGDGEVEVRGTAFDVVVAEDRLEAVVVHHGLVAVRADGVEVEVAGGEQWTRREGVTKVAVLEEPSPSPSPSPSTRSRTADPDPVPAPAPAPAAAADADADAAPAPVSPTEVSFRDGRAALRDGDFAAAADMFARAIDADPDAPLAEDARYWRGVALARAGKATQARAALEDFLARHATSLHAGRAAIVLGNLLAEAGDLEGARARYTDATRDADPDVRAAARKALAALAP